MIFTSHAVHVLPLHVHVHSTVIEHHVHVHLMHNYMHMYIANPCWEHVYVVIVIHTLYCIHYTPSLLHIHIYIYNTCTFMYYIHVHVECHVHVHVVYTCTCIPAELPQSIEHWSRNLVVVTLSLREFPVFLFHIALLSLLTCTAFIEATECVNNEVCHYPYPPSPPPPPLPPHSVPSIPVI